MVVALDGSVVVVLLVLATAENSVERNFRLIPVLLAVAMRHHLSNLRKIYRHKRNTLLILSKTKNDLNKT